jgi:hypothetical protein
VKVKAEVPGDGGVIGGKAVPFTALAQEAKEELSVRPGEGSPAHLDAVLHMDRDIGRRGRLGKGPAQRPTTELVPM